MKKGLKTLLVIVLVLVAFIGGYTFYSISNPTGTMSFLKIRENLGKNKDKDNKYITYTDYSYNFTHDSYTLDGKTYYSKDLQVPYINIDTEDAKYYNDVIKNIFTRCADTFEEADGYTNCILESSYAINGDIISIVVTTQMYLHKDYKVFNISTSGQQVSYEDVLKYKIDKLNMVSKNASSEEYSQALKYIDDVVYTKISSEHDKYSDAYTSTVEFEEDTDKIRRAHYVKGSDYYLDSEGKINAISLIYAPIDKGYWDVLITLEDSEVSSFVAETSKESTSSIENVDTSNLLTEDLTNGKVVGLYKYEVQLNDSEVEDPYLELQLNKDNTFSLVRFSGTTKSTSFGLYTIEGAKVILNTLYATTSGIDVKETSIKYEFMLNDKGGLTVVATNIEFYGELLNKSFTKLYSSEGLGFENALRQLVYDRASGSEADKAYILDGNLTYTVYDGILSTRVIEKDDNKESATRKYTSLNIDIETKKILSNADLLEVLKLDADVVYYKLLTELAENVTVDSFLKGTDGDVTAETESLDTFKSKINAYSKELASNPNLITLYLSEQRLVAMYNQIDILNELNLCTHMGIGLKAEPQTSLGKI